MKKIILILIALLTIVSCKKQDENDNYWTETGEILKGDHKLRKFNVNTEKGERWQASYFLIAGSASGETYTKSDVTFSWLNNNGEYVISTLPIQKIRIKIEDSIKDPYVTFRWEGSHSTDIQTIMSWRVRYMVVHCSEESYKSDININGL